MHKVDPLARQVGKSSEPLRLEAPHLTRRSRAPLRRFAADNPAHSRIVAQALVASSGGRNPAEQVPIPIHPLGAPWPPRSIQDKLLIAISESRRPRRNSARSSGECGLKAVGGAAFAEIGYANSIRVGKAEALGVTVAVHRGNPFGNRVDGLLGMSFLSRFTVTLSPTGIELTAIPLR